MPYDMDIQVYADYLRVEISGNRIRGREYEDGLNVWARVAEISREKEIFRVLAVTKLSGRLPIMPAYNLAKSPELFAADLKFKLAYVDLNEESRQDNLFTETVAVNRGYNIKIFDNEDAAKDWLFNS